MKLNTSLLIILLVVCSFLLVGCKYGEFKLDTAYSCATLKDQHSNLTLTNVDVEVWLGLECVAICESEGLSPSYLGKAYDCDMLDDKFSCYCIPEHKPPRPKEPKQSLKDKYL